MPANAGRRPGYQHRDRNTTEPDIAVDRIEKSTSGNSQHRTTSSTISFSDPWKTAEKEFELYHRTNLPKLVSKCQENCGILIKVVEVMVVRSYGRITWTEKSTGKERVKFGPMHIHFHENCLKNFSETFYAPDQSCDFSKMYWPKDTRKAYGSRQNIAAVIGNEVKFQKTVFDSPVYYQIFYEKKHVGLWFLVNLG